MASVELFKKRIGRVSSDPIFYRPIGYCDCSLFNSDKVKGAVVPAFPSGHMATSTFLVLALFSYLEVETFYWILGFVYLFLMGVSRYKKRCHNSFQILCGFIYGCICFVFFQQWIVL
jgi:membrane-associated phospholipid phosphatase